MYVMILNILVYAHDSLMVMLYYCKTLGRRYSMKVTVLAAVIWWVVQSASKLPFMYLAEDYNMNVIMVVQCAVMIAYLLIFYGSSLAKKLLAFMLMSSALGVGEFTSILIAGHIFDMGSRPLELGSDFTIAGLLIMRPMATLAYYTAFQIWNVLQHSIWIHGGRQWLCALLPLSQVFLLWYLTEIYTEAGELLPIPVLTGVFLAFAADIYMFVIFDRAQEKESMENELCLKKHLREMEQVRYERLCAFQEETAKLRHDFQNYLLTLRAMPEADSAVNEEREMCL